MRDIDNQVARLQQAARGNSSRISRLNEIRTRYTKNIHNANPNFDRAAEMQRDVNLRARQGGSSARELQRTLRDSRRIMSEAYNQQVARSVYMGNTASKGNSAG